MLFINSNSRTNSMNRNNFLLLTRKTNFINDKGKRNGFENRTIQIHSYFNNYLTTYKRIECYLNSTRQRIPPSRIMLEDFNTWSNMPPQDYVLWKPWRHISFLSPKLYGWKWFFSLPTWCHQPWSKHLNMSQPKLSSIIDTLFNN